jgi:hypothetical protein
MSSTDTPTTLSAAGSLKGAHEVAYMSNPTAGVVSAHHDEEKGSGSEGGIHIHDAVWGDIDGDGPNYRGLGW